jgi:hypothetical protein
LFQTLDSLIVKFLPFVKTLQSSSDFLLQSLYHEPLIQNPGEYFLELGEGLLILPVVSLENQFSYSSRKLES